MVKKAKKAIKRQLVRETLYGEPYEYYPLGKYIVAARLGAFAAVVPLSVSSA